MINTDKIRNLLNILFMLLAAVAIVLYFMMDEVGSGMFIYVCGVAVFFKVAELFIRFMRIRK